MKLLKYIGPHDEVTDSNERPTWTCVRGGTVSVTDEQAGRPPTARYLEIQAELPLAQGPGDHARRHALVEELLSEDPGCGMLAQYDSWQLATTPEEPEPTKAKTKKDGNP